MCGRTPRCVRGGLCPSRPHLPGQGPGLRPGVRPQITLAGETAAGTSLFFGTDLEPGLALALLVARVLADDHDPAVPADDPALVADPFDARLDLHGSALLSRPRRYARAHAAPKPELGNLMLTAEAIRGHL